jgi:hypothetical protein
MSDDWDFWFTRLDEHAISIFVDLGIKSDVPIRGYAQLGFVRLQLQKPRPDGLSSSEEYPNLIQVEDALSASLCVDAKRLYVGRTTSLSGRVFYYYLQEPSDFASAVATAMSEFPDYQFKTGVQEDASWEFYRGFLYPPAEDLGRIGNRRVCSHLEEQGDDLAKPRKIDHFAYFSDSASKEAFLQYLLAEGFDVESDSEDSRGQFAVAFSRSDVPQQIDEVTLPLFRQVNELGGEYDGWGCAATS